MKNLLYISVIALLTFSACSKCQTCTLNGIEEEVCQDEFISSSEYTAYIRSVELLGGECK